jgi:hypothetical protein
MHALAVNWAAVSAPNRNFDMVSFSHGRWWILLELPRRSCCLQVEVYGTTMWLHATHISRYGYNHVAYRSSCMACYIANDKGMMVHAEFGAVSMVSSPGTL